MTAIHGRREIRLVLAQIIARGIEVYIESSNMIEAGEITLGRERWRVRLARTGGSSFEQAVNPILVQRPIAGQWKLAIAALWGWGEAS